MVKSGRLLKLFHSKTVQICTYVCNHIAKRLKELFPNISTLIDNGKIIFFKLLCQISIFQKEINNILLPPVPIITKCIHK